MTYLRTIDPPAVVSYFTPRNDAPATNVWSHVSLIEQRIRSAFESAGRELSRYRDYSARWDGYDASAFEPEVLDDAGSILRFSEAAFLNSGVIPSLVTTGPASDGSVDVELEVGDRRLLMTLYPREDQLRLAWFQANESREQAAPLRTAVVGEWLSWLHHSSNLPKGLD
jgi:hypothetical protein